MNIFDNIDFSRFVDRLSFMAVGMLAGCGNGSSSEAAEKKSITGYGLIEIPAIELEMPLVKGADAYSLRAAVGWWPQSAEMGTAGN